MKHVKIFIFAALALVSAVTIRTIQLLFLTDSSTGFYKTGLESLGTALMVVLIGIIAIASTLIFLFKPQPVSNKPSSMLLGCSLLFVGIASIAEPFINEASLSAVPTAFLGVRMLLILAAGVVFCWYAVAVLFSVKIRPALSIVLIISWVVRLMSSFTCFTKMSNISENLYDVLMLISTLVFLLLFGKNLCKISSTETNRRLISVGIAAVLFSAVSSIPAIIAKFANGFEFIHVPFDSPVTSLFMAFFMGVYIFELCKETKAE